MARILHIGQKVENFQAFGSAIERYQNAESVQFYERERGVEKAQVRISYKLNERLKILWLHSGVFTAARTVSRGRSERIYLSIYLWLHVKRVFIKALQIKTQRKFELRLSMSVHLLENVNRFFFFLRQND